MNLSLTSAIILTISMTILVLSPSIDSRVNALTNVVDKLVTLLPGFPIQTTLKIFKHSSLKC